jgi:hypothetical protein
MPGRLEIPSIASLPPPKSSSKSGSKDALSKALMPEDEDAIWERRRAARRVTNGYTARESSVRGRGRGRDDDDEEDLNTTPARKARKTRNSMAPAVATRAATRSSSRRPGAADDGESVVSSVMESPRQIETSSAVASRAVTPTSLRPPKKQKTGLRVKSS